MSSTQHVLQNRSDQAAQTLAVAFADDPVMCWIFHDPATRDAQLLAFMAMATERSRSVGHAFELVDGDGVALWCPPEVHFFTEAMGLEFYELALTSNGARTDMVLTGLSEMGEHHPEQPHFYLANVGVDPGSRGKGNGAKLLDRVLGTCDDEGIVAYLESSNPRNITLYERAGFEVTAEIHLPEGPIMRPMVRQPR